MGAVSELGSGDRVGGWELVWQLGQGAQGTVFRATGPDGRTGALKLAHGGAGEGARARFAREIRLRTELRIPGLPELLDHGDHQGRPWFATALVEGRAVQALIGARLSTGAVSTVIRGVASAVAGLHAAGVVHRDLSPGNVRVDEGGDVWLLDLGVAAGPDDGGLTRDGGAPGARTHAPPEAFGDPPGAVGPAWDAYAVGVLAWELLSGQPAWAEVAPSDLRAAKQQPLRAPATTPEPLASLVSALTHPDPAQRPPLRPWRRPSPCGR
ncbi:MAG: serine/threonine protein kinase [Alphaproteobacteria bacterium]|nr:serine/threonine protein kinase [Alphaproteobacteria bacterium]MCB9698863.1 serine/threonine protein kinase [Alphaproteobacteria bacterium]